MKIIYIFFRITLTKVSNVNILISFKMIPNKGFLVSKTQGLQCHELIFCKSVNLRQRRNWDES